MGWPWGIPRGRSRSGARGRVAEIRVLSRPCRVQGDHMSHHQNRYPGTTDSYGNPLDGTIRHTISVRTVNQQKDELRRRHVLREIIPIDAFKGSSPPPAMPTCVGRSGCLRLLSLRPTSLGTDRVHGGSSDTDVPRRGGKRVTSAEDCIRTDRRRSQRGASNTSLVRVKPRSRGCWFRSVGLDVP